MLRMVGCWRLVPGGMLLVRVTVRYATYGRMLETCPRKDVTSEGDY